MKDLFSRQAKAYAKFRPSYPTALYNFLLQHVEGRDHACDIGTGNGQVATVLAPYFNRIYATDISGKQLENAQVKQGVEYIKCPAENSPFPASSMDLITVAQALHWFDHVAFNKEVKRIVKKGGSIAVWGYGLLHINTEIDHIVRDFHDNVLRDYWALERKHIETEYRDIPFPYHRVLEASFSADYEWDFMQMSGYLGTWSSVNTYLEKQGRDPRTDILPALEKAWGKSKRQVSFPIFLRLGRAHPDG